MTIRTGERPVHWGAWPAWLDRARQDGITPACDGVDQAVFFPEKAAGAMKAVTQAKKICRRCPLKDTCREWALQQHPTWLYGVWGGLSRGQRIAMAAKGEQPEQLRKHNR